MMFKKSLIKVIYIIYLRLIILGLILKRNIFSCAVKLLGLSRLCKYPQQLYISYKFVENMENKTIASSLQN